MRQDMKNGERFRLIRLKAKEVNSVLAYAASLMLTGVPPIVCESAIQDLLSSVKKSLNSLL